MAAGTSSRFVPLSFERPKGLLNVKGEILIERQICQLKEAGVDDITLVVGYKADMFHYLKHKFGVDIVINNYYNKYNNISSIACVKEKLSDTFVCCSDHYFKSNVFLARSKESFYAARFASGPTDEYCLNVDGCNYIKSVNVGGRDSWYMAGHVYFSDSFSNRFRNILTYEYEKEEVRYGYWEDVFIKHLDELPMKIKHFSDDEIAEFDTLDELRLFDATYVADTHSSIIKLICKEFNCKEEELDSFNKVAFSEDRIVFRFRHHDEQYQMFYGSNDYSIKKT